MAVAGAVIREKVAASSVRGMWLGGSVSLGHEVKDRRLIVVSG